MALTSAISRMFAFCFQHQTARTRVLDQRARFISFKKKWRECPKLDFAYEQRECLYRYVQENVIENASIHYLEFGCYKGASIKTWARINSRPESRFFGFDSFEGLPEPWQPDTPKGTFSTGGTLPQCEDPRIRFVKGWFQETLAPFLRDFVPASRLVVHLDADLYSSTLYVLITLNPGPGSVLIFDEFSDFTNEFRAFEDYLAACQRNYRVIVTRKDFHKLAIEIF